MIKFFQSFGGVFVLKVVSEFGFGNGKCHFSSVEQIFPFCGWCWIDMLGKLPLFSSFVKHWRNDVIPQKMTRPTPRWHPLLVFLSPCQAWDVTPRTLFHHLQFQVPVSVSHQKVHKKMAATHSFWSIFFTVLPLSGCKFHPVSVSTLGGPIWKSATNAETFPFRNSYCRFSFESPLSL